MPKIVIDDKEVEVDEKTAENIQSVIDSGGKTPYEVAATNEVKRILKNLPDDVRKRVDEYLKEKNINTDNLRADKFVAAVNQAIEKLKDMGKKDEPDNDPENKGPSDEKDFQKRLDKIKLDTEKQIADFKKEQLEKEKSGKISSYKKLLAARAKSLKNGAEKHYLNALNEQFNFDLNDSGEVEIRLKNGDPFSIDGKLGTADDVEGFMKKKESLLFGERKKGSELNPGNDKTGGIDKKIDVEGKSPDQLIEEGIDGGELKEITEASTKSV